MRRAAGAACLAALGIAVFLPLPAASSAAGPKPQVQPEAPVLFAVEEAPGLASHWLEPVATLEAGDYHPVPVSCGGENAEAASAFLARYLAPGRSYALLSGGRQIGSVVSSGQADPMGSPGSLADLRLAGARVPATAIATNSTSLARPQGRRREPTAAERRQAAEVAKQIFREHKVAEQDVARLRADGLAVADLEGRGEFSLIATFVIPTPDDSGIQDSLFFVVKPALGSEPTLLWYDHPASVSQGEELLYVDQIPRLPGEPDDILVHAVSYANSTYRIYRFHVINWRHVFETPVYGCL